MSIRNLALATALCAVMAAGAMPLLAQADDEAAAPMSAASATPLLRTPAEKRDNATPPDLRPEQAAIPQLSIPLGRTRPVAGPVGRGASAASAAAIGGINDGAARCEAKASAIERATCRSQLAHETKPH
jgi:hypothetical protein